VAQMLGQTLIGPIPLAAGPCRSRCTLPLRKAVQLSTMPVLVVKDADKPVGGRVYMSTKVVESWGRHSGTEAEVAGYRLLRPIRASHEYRVRASPNDHDQPKVVGYSG